MTNTASAVPAAIKRAPLPSLTGLRWVAAFMVFGFHLGTLHVMRDSAYSGPLGQVFGLGASGVQFFFILSGFVLVWSARTADTARAFLQRRFAKIYPNHVVTWAIVIGIALWWHDSMRLDIVLANLFLVQTWTPAPGFAYSVNTVSWTLSCELFFYLSLPLLLPLVRRMSTRALTLAIVVTPIVIYEAGPLIAHVPGVDGWWFTQLFPPVRALEFLLGVIAAELMIRREWRGPGLWPSTAVFLAIYVGVRWLPGSYESAVLAVAYLILIAGAARADITGAWSPWRTRVMVWLGEVSFAYYLVHVQIIVTVQRYLGRSQGWHGIHGAIAAVFFLCLSLGAAWSLYHFVEIPMMRLLRPRPRRAPAAAGNPPEVPADVAAVHDTVAVPPEPPAGAEQPPPAAATAVSDPPATAPEAPLDTADLAT